MIYRTGAALAVMLVGLAGPVAAKSLPAVQLTPANQPQQCTTPGRLMAFIRSRNPRLRDEFATIANEYVRHGRELAIRWDYAFFQMIVETNSLKFTGDVNVRQNNFAGLGATGGGVKGESFRSVSDGVRAHLQHLMLYAGVRVDNPVAERTRKVQAWGVLDKWHRKFRRPITFADVGAQWAPVDRGYGKDIQAIADAFYSSHCNRRDPSPDMLAEAAAEGTKPTDNAPSYSPGDRAALGASNVESPSTSAPATNYKTLNHQPDQDQDQTAAGSQGTKSAAAAARFAAPAIQPSATKCRVWTASYGGQKATIIRSSAEGTINYTVLDVNQGREEAETKAYIAAYAKGGRRVGDYPSKAAAMDQAFKLCPKG